jgi:iron complex transport system substrate-binding protein
MRTTRSPLVRPAVPDALPVDNATRRQFLSILAAAGLLSACGSDDTAAPASGGGTRTFVDVTGNGVEVPDVATRIVATNDQNAGAQLLSLGAPVVGIASRDGVIDPSIKAYFDVDDLVTVGEHFEPDIETIAGLRPDLIVHEGYQGAISMEDATLDELRQIAPVVGIDAFRPVEEVIGDHARLLGAAATARMDQQKAEFYEVLEELRAVLGDAWKDVVISLMVFNGDTMEAWAELGETDILTRVGTDVVPLMKDAALPENGGYIANISLGRIPEFSADIVMVDTSFGGAELLKNPIFQRLPAARAGQVVEIESSVSAVHFPGYVTFTKKMLEWMAGRDLRTDLV